jgi:nitrogen fixation protein FixH
MSEASATRRGAGRRWIPLLALAPLLALLVADAVMLVLAARTDPGLVADAPRRVGLARLAPAAALRLDATLAPVPGGYALRVRLRDEAGEAVPAALAEARLERTTHAGDDRPLDLSAAPDGGWLAEFALPEGGAWQVTVRAHDAAGRSALAVLRLAP